MIFLSLFIFCILLPVCSLDEVPKSIETWIDESGLEHQGRASIDSKPLSSSETDLLQEKRRIGKLASNFKALPAADVDSILSLHNKHQGERCFIFGNGPSLNAVDLRPLAKEVTIGVNGIFLNHENMGFYPTYYVVEDILVALTRREAILSMKGPIKLFGTYLKSVLDSSGGNDTIFIPVNMDYGSASQREWPHFSTDLSQVVHVGGSVTFICLQLAYYLGCSSVYLLGFDNRYQVNVADNKQDGNVLLSQEDADPNHFDKSYFGKGLAWHIPDVARMERGYRKAALYFSWDHRALLNAGPNSLLTAYDKVDYALVVPESTTAQESPYSVFSRSHLSDDKPATSVALCLRCALDADATRSDSASLENVINVDENAINLLAELMKQSFEGAYQIELVLVFNGCEAPSTAQVSPTILQQLRDLPIVQGARVHLGYPQRNEIVSLSLSENDSLHSVFILAYFFAKAGLSFAKNQAVLGSGGETVAFLDDDGTIGPKWLAAVHNFTTRPSNLQEPALNDAGFTSLGAMALGGAVKFKWIEVGVEAPSLKNIHSLFDPPPLGVYRGAANSIPVLVCLISSYKTHYRRALGGNMAIRRGLFARTGMFDENLGRLPHLKLGFEEVELQTRMFRLNYTVMFDPSMQFNHFYDVKKVQSMLSTSGISHRLTAAVILCKYARRSEDAWRHSLSLLHLNESLSSYPLDYDTRVHGLIDSIYKSCQIPDIIKVAAKHFDCKGKGQVRSDHDPRLYEPLPFGNKNEFW